MGLGGPELLIILVLVLVVFGAGRLPNVMRDLGKSLREMRDLGSDADKAAKELLNSGDTCSPPHYTEEAHRAAYRPRV